jgi:hypothetical protein
MALDFQAIADSMPKPTDILALADAATGWPKGRIAEYGGEVLGVVRRFVQSLRDMPQPAARQQAAAAGRQPASDAQTRLPDARANANAAGACVSECV